ncbi:MAG: sulfite exporter TauE/SafE family protein [Nitrososphaerota archaeon]
MLEPLIHLLMIILLGLFAGSLGAMLGLGGGIITVPALMILAGFDAHHAIGTSMSAIVFAGAASALAYHRQGRLDWRLALVAETTAMPGSFLGAMLTGLAAPSSLKILFSIFLIALALSIIFRRSSPADEETSKRERGETCWKRILRDSRGEVFAYSVDLLKLLPASFLAGVISGFFGVGGGGVNVPLMYHIGVPMHVAVATSTLMIALTALSGAIGHILLGHVKLIELLALAPGIIAGAQLGASAARRTSSPVLRKMFSSVLIVMAIILLAG